MPRILSISRRTDVPAWYGTWFMERLSAGFAGWRNPISGEPYVVSLRREDVRCLAFWSKNIRPFLPHLRTLRREGRPCFLNVTITGLPACFERRAAPADDAVEALAEASDLLTPELVTWRYDPVLVSDLTPATWHLKRFAGLAARLENHVRRCVFSFPSRYGKVRRSFARLARDEGLNIPDLPQDARLALAGRLAAIATRHGIALQACCDDTLVGGPIGKARCIDGDAIAQATGGAAGAGPRGSRPTRPACGCAGSIDIGCYDTCPTGCVYCYANADWETARKAFADHDPHAAFLGHSRGESERFLDAVREREARARQSRNAPALPGLDGPDG